MTGDWATLNLLADNIPHDHHVSDEAVHRLYGEKMAANFKANGVTVHTVILPGEEVGTVGQTEG